MLALRCPRCGADLPARSQQRVFVCEECSATSMASGRDGEGFMVLDRILVRPLQEFDRGERLFLLPVWQVMQRGGGEFRIPAVGMGQMSLVLAMAQRMTAIATAWSVWEPSLDLRRSAADLHVEDAYSLAEVVGMRLQDPGENPPVLGGARLLDWPCVRRSSQTIELVGGMATSGRLLEGLSPVARGPELMAVAEVDLS